MMAVLHNASIKIQITIRRMELYFKIRNILFPKSLLLHINNILIGFVGVFKFKANHNSGQ